MPIRPSGVSAGVKGVAMSLYRSAGSSSMEGWRGVGPADHAESCIGVCMHASLSTRTKAAADVNLGAISHPGTFFLIQINLVISTLPIVDVLGRVSWFSTCNLHLYKHPPPFSSYPIHTYVPLRGGALNCSEKIQYQNLNLFF